MQATCCWCGLGLQRYSTGVWLCPTKACRDRQWAWAFITTTKKTQTVRYLPTPRQTEFHESQAKYTLFGGAAGPGKSHALRWEFYKRCVACPGYEALILRRTFPELHKTHIRRAEREQGLIGARLYTGDEKSLKFANGSLLEFGHCEDERAIARYLSTEYDAIGFDEWSTFEPEMALEIMTRARSSKPGIRALVKGGSNPGGPGSLFLLDFFIDHQPDFARYPKLRETYRVDQWKFVPALLDDNPYRDPEYEDELAILEEDRYEQLRFGNWRRFAGQFFSGWRETHETADGSIPWHVRRLAVDPETEHFVSLDWGYRAPGCALWWACLADGHYHVRKAWPFKGLEADEAGRQILKMTKELGIKRLRYVVADPSMWNKGGDAVTVKGESKAETMRRVGLPMRKGDNDRINGWSRCSLLLRPPIEGGLPRFSIDPDECRYLRRTIPAAVSDRTNREDVDTTIDDHGLDAWRYGAMSRPSPTRIVIPKRPKGTAGKLLEEHLTELAVA